LSAGSKAPDFSLPAVPSPKGDGGNFSLQAALKQGPVLAAFFKVSCPVCQYAFPFIERIHRAQGGEGKLTVVGISQDNQRDTSSFLKEFGVTFPTLLDDPNGYAVSNAYGLTNVPTVFLIAPEGEIELSSVGWVKQDMEEINRKLASARMAPPPAIFQPGEDVHDFRPG
jgi:cytochrome c biogenesis protein CcmG/thiol:disulfide interchange protein DsbE